MEIGVSHARRIGFIGDDKNSSLLITMVLYVVLSLKDDEIVPNEVY